ncbi:MAG: hypothetical protein IH944_01940 [Armatimonadetes bacterium]|nr:hypothetical protein [Armatimonadota bacterium]
MGRTFYFLTVIAVCALSTAVLGQGGGSFGGGGGGGFGGGFGQGGGSDNDTYEEAVLLIDSEVDAYLETNEIKNILTTGEISQWTLKLEAGQVLIADARSDAFDPALQVIFLEEDEDEEAEGIVLAENDDRYPGDQRPLLIWRCERDGEYRLRARCFRDKSGGQFFLRMRIYDSMDLLSEKPVDMQLDGQEKILIRIPMKAGQIKKVIIELPNRKEYVWGRIEGVISPTGLPDIELTRPMRNVISDAVMAAVDGDYYVIVRPSGPSDWKLRARIQDIVEVALSRKEGRYTVSASRNTLSLWTLDVKEGDILQVSTPGLSLSSRFALAEHPDISEYDVGENDTNPFFPQPVDEKDDEGPAFVKLPGRARDPRITVFVVRRDATLWLASNGLGGTSETYTLSITPAARDFTAVSERKDQLRIGYTDYWAFDAEVGDVMTFKTKAKGFAERVIVYDPDLSVTESAYATVDETETDWSLIVRKPGRYLVAISAIGDGGSGPYTLERHVFGAREFGKGSPAQGDFSSGRAEVWKFMATPDEPLLVHWRSSNWAYTISIRDERGVAIELPLTTVDGNNKYGVLKVNEPTTYLIVLVSNGGKSNYSITLRDLPGR